MELRDAVDEKEYVEILARLEDKHFADVVEKSAEWEVIRKAAKQLRDVTQEQYNHMDHSAPDAALKAIQCQVTIQFYDNFLAGVLQRYQALGEEAYGHAKEMGMLSGIAQFLKSNF